MTLQSFPNDKLVAAQRHNVNASFWFHVTWLSRAYIFAGSSRHRNENFGLSNIIFTYAAGFITVISRGGDELAANWRSI